MTTNALYIEKLNGIKQELENHKTFYDEHRRTSPAYRLFLSRDEYLLEQLLEIRQELDTSCPQYQEALQLLHNVLDYHDKTIPKHQGE